MSSILDLPGFVGAFIIALAIVVPVLMKTLRRQNAALRLERAEREAAGSLPGMAAAQCPQCRAINLVPVSAERALCGNCQHELVRSPAASVP